MFERIFLSALTLLSFSKLSNFFTITSTFDKLLFISLCNLLEFFDKLYFVISISLSSHAFKSHSSNLGLIIINFLLAKPFLKSKISPFSIISFSNSNSFR